MCWDAKKGENLTPIELSSIGVNIFGWGGLRVDLWNKNDIPTNMYTVRGYQITFRFVLSWPPLCWDAKKGENLTPIELSSIGVNILGCISIQGGPYEKWLWGLTCDGGGCNICPTSKLVVRHFKALSKPISGISPCLDKPTKLRMIFYIFFYTVLRT